MAKGVDDPAAIVHACPCSPGDPTPIVLDCELALLGALLRSYSVEQAMVVLTAVADEDFENPWIRRAIALARGAVDDGAVPVASVLLARLTTAEGRHQYQVMARLLVDAWFAGPPPIVAWPLVVAVLEGSYRRAVRCWADRVRQASTGPLDVVDQVRRDDHAVRAAWRRLSIASRPSRRRPTTGTVAPIAQAGRAGDASDAAGSPSRAQMDTTRDPAEVTPQGDIGPTAAA